MIPIIIASIATLLIIISYIPQIVKSFKLKTMKEFSMGYLALICTSVFLWIIYGVAVGDKTILYANVVIILFALSLVIMKIKFDRSNK